MKPRIIKPLLYGTSVAIDPAEWRQVAGVKTFDAKNTAILRAFRNLKTSTYMLYAMRGDNGKKAAEAYELVPTRDFAAEALLKVATHCGLEPMAEEVAKAIP